MFITEFLIKLIIEFTIKYLTQVPATLYKCYILIKTTGTTKKRKQTRQIGAPQQRDHYRELWASSDDLHLQGGPTVQQATWLQDMLQVEVIYRQVHSLRQGQISSRSESERCTNVNSNHGYCWNVTAEIGDLIGGFHKYNVVQQGGAWHR